VWACGRVGVWACGCGCEGAAVTVCAAVCYRSACGVQPMSPLPPRPHGSRTLTSPSTASYHGRAPVTSVALRREVGAKLHGAARERESGIDGLEVGLPWLSNPLSLACSLAFSCMFSRVHLFSPSLCVSLVLSLSLPLCLPASPPSLLLPFSPPPRPIAAPSYPSPLEASGWRGCSHGLRREQ
jgi:hypothetical protein